MPTEPQNAKHQAFCHRSIKGGIKLTTLNSVPDYYVWLIIGYSSQY